MPDDVNAAGRKHRWATAFRFAASIALLAAIASRVELEGSLEQIARLPAAAVLTAIGLLLAQTVVLSLRWAILARIVGAPLTTGRAIAAGYVGLFFNQVLPTSLGGDAIRAWECHRGGANLGASVRSVVLDRITGVVVLALSSVGAALIVGREVIGDAAWLAMLAAAGVVVFAVAVISVADRVRLPAYLRKRLAGALQIAADLRAVLLIPRALAPPAALSFASAATAAVAMLVLARGIGVGAPGPQVFALCFPIFLVMVVPISLAGWGLREGAAILLLGRIGVSAEDALATSVAFGLALAVSSLPGAVLWLAQWKHPTR